MVTNTYAPHVGGVARSVQRFAEEYRKLGHSVTVVAPGEAQPGERNVSRIPSIPDINGSSFNFPLINKFLENSLIAHEIFTKPDVIHSHHPFLLGNVARKLSTYFKVPLVFTHHTMYEQFSYVAGSVGKKFPQFFANLATEYANACDVVIAPSKSTKEILLARGVKTPIKVCPTGLSLHKFASGDRNYWRNRFSIGDAPVIGHLGRLAPEKNLDFLLDAIEKYLTKYPIAHAMVVGDGPSADKLKARKIERCHFTGSLNGQELTDAYHAMDIFAFSSKSETQGMVLVEAMAAGLPVVACFAPGVKDVVKNHYNGMMVEENIDQFISALGWTLKNKNQLSINAIESSKIYSQDLVARAAINIYKNTQFGNKNILALSRIIMRAGETINENL